MITKRSLLLSFGILGVVAFGAAALPTGGESTGDSDGNTLKPGALKHLEDTLDQIQRAWNPRVEARIVARARRETAKLMSPLLLILSRPAHHLLGEAIYLTSELGLQRARPAVRDADYVTSLTRCANPKGSLAWPQLDLRRLLPPITLTVFTLGCRWL